MVIEYLHSNGREAIALGVLVVVQTSTGGVTGGAVVELLATAHMNAAAVELPENFHTNGVVEESWGNILPLQDACAALAHKASPVRWAVTEPQAWPQRDTMTFQNPESFR